MQTINAVQLVDQSRIFIKFNSFSFESATTSIVQKSYDQSIWLAFSKLTTKIVHDFNRELGKSFFRFYFEWTKFKLNSFASETSCTTLHRDSFNFFSSFRINTLLVMTKAAKSISISSKKDDIVQHEPIKKQTWGKEEKIMQVMTNDSMLKAIKYPCGVLQLNGNLNEKFTWKIYQKKIDIDYVKLTLMEWVECRIHGPN